MGEICRLPFPEKVPEPGRELGMSGASISYIFQVDQIPSVGPSVPILCFLLARCLLRRSPWVEHIKWSFLLWGDAAMEKAWQKIE